MKIKNPLIIALCVTLALVGCRESLNKHSKDSASKVATLPLLKPQAYNPNITPKSLLSQTTVAAQREPLAREFSDKGLRLGSPIFIRIFKESRDFEIWVKEENKNTFALFKTYKVATFSGGLGPKKAEGDRKAPEGFYFVPPSMMNPSSRFHLSFNLGYPNNYDKARGYTGSALMVHGNRVSIGCFAMTDTWIEEIYSIADSALSAGQPFFRVHSFPFRLTEANLAKHKKSPHIEFWKNLREGYETFEKSHIPPNVSAKDQRYVFSY